MSIQIKIDIDKATIAELVGNNRKTLSKVLDSIALSFLYQAEEIRKFEQDVDLSVDFSLGLTYSLNAVTDSTKKSLRTPWSNPEGAQELTSKLRNYYEEESARASALCGRCKHQRYHHREDGCSVVSAGCDCMKFVEES